MTFNQIVAVFLVIFVVIVVAYLYMSNQSTNRDKERYKPPSEKSTEYEEKDNENDSIVVGIDELMDSEENEPVVPYEDETHHVGCPIEDTEKELKEYYNRLYSSRELCDREKSKVALCEHTNFRGKVNGSSSQFGPDSVDKINSLYLSDNSSESRRLQGETIRDVFDGITCSPENSVRHKIRVPDFDANDHSKANLV